MKLTTLAHIKARMRSVEQFHTFLALFSIALVLIAYLPTLQYNYAMRDQWRAFMLPASFSRARIALTCARDALPFYIRSGRPLIWIGECAERTIVSHIDDFRVLRLIPIFITIALVLYTSKLLSSRTGQPLAGFITPALLVLLPGYYYMLELGLNGAPVLLGILCGCAAYSKVIVVVDKSATGFPTSYDHQLTYGIITFLTGCFIFPAWALIVFPMAMLLWLGTKAEDLARAAKSLAFVILYFGVATFLYFAIIKGLIGADLFGAATVNMGDGRYDFSVVTSLSVILSRYFGALRYLATAPLWDLKLAAPFLVFSIFCLIYVARSRVFYSVERTLRAYAYSFASILLLLPAMVALSIAPWLLSHMWYYSARFFLIFYIIPVLSVSLAITLIADRIPSLKLPLTVLVLASCLLVSFRVSKIMTLDALSSIVRTDLIERKVEAWVDSGLYKTERVILLVPPYGNKSEPRPVFIHDILNYPDQDGIGLWSGDVNTYYQVLSAVMRERPNNPVLGKVANCVSNINCADRAIKEGRLAFVLMPNGGKAITLPAQPLVIDMSSLTKAPVGVRYHVHEIIVPSEHYH